VPAGRPPRPNKSHWRLTASRVAPRALVVAAAVPLVSVVPEPVRATLEAATAGACLWIITSFGVDATQLAARELLLANHVFRFDYACTAIHSLAMFVAVVAVTPVSRRRRLEAVGYGTLAILAANQLRLLGIAAISQHAPEHFNWVHAYTFQALMVLFVLGAWVLWLHIARADWLPGWE
jgi:exosortase/archaeosortase family protein